MGRRSGTRSTLRAFIVENRMPGATITVASLQGKAAKKWSGEGSKDLKKAGKPAPAWVQSAFMPHDDEKNRFDIMSQKTV